MRESASLQGSPLWRRLSTYQVVVHVARIPQCPGCSSHDRRNELVLLAIARIGAVQPIRRDPSQRSIIERNDRVRLLYESLDGQHGIVGLHDYVGGLFVVREDRVSLDDLLGEMLLETLEQEGA